MADTYNPLALACTAAAGAARGVREAQTVCIDTEATEPFVVLSSQQVKVLKENRAFTPRYIPLASFLPNGTLNVYPAGKDYPYFSNAGA